MNYFDPSGEISWVAIGIIAICAVIVVGIELDPNSGKFEIMPPIVGIGWSGSIDWDVSH